MRLLAALLVVLVAACGGDRERERERAVARRAAFARSARRFAALVPEADPACAVTAMQAAPDLLSARLELTCRGAREGFTLRPPSADRSHPAAQFFQIQPDDPPSAADRDRVSGLLARVFTSDPWTAAGGTFDAANAVGLRHELALLAALALTFVGGLAYVLAAAPRDAPPGRGPRGLDLALAAAVAAAAFGWLHHVNGGAWTGRDQTTGLLMARDCIRLSTCQLTGVDSGVRGFTNGALWPHLLTLVGLLGGATPAVSRALMGLMAAGVGAVFLCAWRWLRPAVALPAALFALLGVASGHGPSAGPGDLSTANLVDASFAFFPTTLCACALLVFVRSGRLAALVVAALFASHAMNTHVAGVALLPALVAAAALAGRPPLLAAALALAVHLGATLLSSPVALRNSLSHLQPNEKSMAAVAVVACALVCALASRRFQRLGPVARAALLAAALIAPTAGGALLLHLAHREFSTRYFAPVIAPLAAVAAALLVLAVDLLTWRRARLAPLTFALPALVALACVVRYQAPHEYGGWTFEHGRVVAEHLNRRGWCYGRQFARLQTTQCTSLGYAIMPYACHADDDPGAASSRRQARVWQPEPGPARELPRGAATLPTRDGRGVALAEIDSWIDPAGAELCITALGPGGTGTPTCTRPDEPDAEPFLFSHRLGFGFRDANLPQPFRMTYSFPLRPDAGQTHRLAFPDTMGPVPGVQPGVDHARGCGWQVARVVGVEPDRPLPANPVRLTSRDGAPGRIVLERVVGQPPCMDPFPGQQIPCVWETTADDPAWMQERAF